MQSVEMSIRTLPSIMAASEGRLDIVQCLTMMDEGGCDTM